MHFLLLDFSGTSLTDLNLALANDAYDLIRLLFHQMQRMLISHTSKCVWE